MKILKYITFKAGVSINKSMGFDSSLKQLFKKFSFILIAFLLSISGCYEELIVPEPPLHSFNFSSYPVDTIPGIIVSSGAGGYPSVKGNYSIKRAWEEQTFNFKVSYEAAGDFSVGIHYEPLCLTVGISIPENESVSLFNAKALLKIIDYKGISFSTGLAYNTNIFKSLKDTHTHTYDDFFDENQYRNTQMYKCSYDWETIEIPLIIRLLDKDLGKFKAGLDIIGSIRYNNIDIDYYFMEKEYKQEEYEYDWTKVDSNLVENNAAYNGTSPAFGVNFFICYRNIRILATVAHLEGFDIVTHDPWYGFTYRLGAEYYFRVRRNI